MPSPIEPVAGGVRIHVHAQPGAKRTELSGLHGDAIKIRVHAPPIEGRANEEITRFLAELLGIARTKVTLVRGDKSRTKTFNIEDISVEAATKALLG